MAKIQICGDSVQKGQSLALGNFDGVHLGHQAVLQIAQSSGELGVVSFSPHPRRFFSPDAPRFELMNSSTMDRVLRKEGAQSVYRLQFDLALSKLAPYEFLEELGALFSPIAVTTGKDFRFGRDRKGDVALLCEWGVAHNVEVHIAPEVDLGGDKVSSTRIREALISGQPREAARLLGRNHIVNQVVTRGDQRGRDLGFPTANLYPQNVVLPEFGIYATRVHIHDGLFKGDYLGASSLGVRPSFGVNAPNFETHILDFDGDIYGAEISVELIEYIREEKKFDDIDALIEQMHTDVDQCKQILSKESMNA